MKRSSSLCLNLKNMSSFPTRKWISPLPTSILALADLRKRSPKYEVNSKVALHIHYHKVGKDEGVSYSYEDVFGYPFGIPNGQICKLYEHS